MGLRRKLVWIMILTLVLVGILGVAFEVQRVEAIGTIYIRANGSIDPPEAPINTTDMITYYFTQNISSDHHGIVVERDNIVVDGAGYTIEGTRTFGSIGIDLTDRSNVTIKNMEITDFYCGIRLDTSSNNVISGNNIADNGDGIYFYEPSDNNTISENNVADNANYGIALLSSLDNTISRNNITSNNSTGIYSNSSHNNIILGNTITNNFYYGIWFRHSSRNIFYGNRITNMTQWGGMDGRGILLEISDHNNISRNNITDNRGFGIHLVACSNSSITGNNVTNTGNGIYGDDDGYGICLAFGSNNTLTGNTITGNDYGLYLTYPSCTSNTVSGNTITNNGNGIRLDSSNNTLTGNTITTNVDGITLGSYAHYNDIFANNVTANTNWGIYLWDCRNNTLTGNTIINNDYGLYIASFSEHNTILKNALRNNVDGIYLYSCSNNTLSGNTITDNDCGIHFDYSSNNTLTENSILSNDYGITIEGYCYWNSIYHNNFIDNIQQVYVPAQIPTNFWDNGYPSGGNYWDDYNGTDIYSGLGQNVIGSDAIGDTAYAISAYNQDKYPLITTTMFTVGQTTRFGVVWQGETYYVDVVSNSTISNFDFSQSDKLIAFNVTGPSGTTGFCNITIPKNLLEGEPWTVLVNGSTPTPEQIVTFNDTHSFLYFNYNHSIKTVEIKGTHVIPEFPSWTSWLLILIILAITTAITKRRLSKTTSTKHHHPLFSKKSAHSLDVEHRP